MVGKDDERDELERAVEELERIRATVARIPGA